MDIAKSDNTGSVSDFPSLRVTNTNSTQGNGTSTYNYARIDVKSGNGTVFADFGTRYDSSYSGAYIGTETSHPVTLQTGGTERLRIDSSGRVGIGTTSPQRLLHISGGASDAQVIQFTSNTTGNTSVDGTSLGVDSGNDFQMWNWENGYIRFGTSGTERLRITSGGDVLVGTLTTPSTTSYGILLANSGTFLSSRNVSGTSASAQIFGNAGELRVLGNGNVQNTNNSYGQISDFKLKQDIVDASSQWSDIKNIRVRKFRFKSDPLMPLQIGLIAQEVELVSPHLVEETKDTGMDGADLGTTTKGVKYSVLYMKAVKALQEAMERIEQLEENNTAIESRIVALEAA